MRRTSPFAHLLSAQAERPATTVRSKQAAGWVVFEYSLAEAAWVGFDVQGDKWTVPHLHGAEDVEIERRWYRCARPADLVGYSRVPRRPAVDARNA